MDKREILEKLLAMANPNNNASENERNMAKKMIEKYSVNSENLHETEEKDIINFIKITPFVKLKSGGYLISRFWYLEEMAKYYDQQLYEFGEELPSLRKNCIKNINLFKRLLKDEYEANFNSIYDTGNLNEGTCSFATSETYEIEDHHMYLSNEEFNFLGLRDWQKRMIKNEDDPDVVINLK